MKRVSDYAESKTFRLSNRLSIEITVGAGGVVCEWTPAIPAAGLTAKEMDKYRLARAEMLIRLAAMTGARVMCVEM